MVKAKSVIKLLFTSAAFLVLLSACGNSEKPAGESEYQIPGEYIELSKAEQAAKLPAVFAEMCEFESLDLLKQALSLGADPNAMSLDGGSPYLTALMHAMNSENEAEAKAALLLEAGADPDRPDYLGQRALHYAVAGNNAALIKLLVKRRADINAPDETGNTPLITAADVLRYWSGAEQEAMLRLLLANGADVNKTDNSNISALAVVASYGDPEILEPLIKAGADLNAADNGRVTPLMAAAARNPNPETVRLLLAGGADPNLRDSEGNTALEISRFNPNKAVAAEMTAILKEAMK